MDGYTLGRINAWMDTRSVARSIAGYCLIARSSVASPLCCQVEVERRVRECVCVSVWLCVHVRAERIDIPSSASAMTCTWYYQRHFAGVGTCWHFFASDLIYGSVLSEKMTHEMRYYNLWAGYMWECCQYMLTSRSYHVIETFTCPDCLWHCPGICWLLLVYLV